MKNISAWAIRHPVTPMVLFVVLLFMGVVAFIRLPINLNPDISFPMVNVNISQPGAAPTEMETQIAQKVEGSIASIGNVRNITTWISRGPGQHRHRVPDRHAHRSRRHRRARRRAKVRNDLPQGILEPLVQRVNVDGGAIAYYAVTTTRARAGGAAAGSSTTRSPSGCWRLPGVAQVSRSGGVTARSASSSIRRACRRSAHRGRGQRAAARPQSRLPPAAAPRWAAASSRSACSAARKSAQAARATRRSSLPRRALRRALREIADVHDGVDGGALASRG